MLIHLKNDVKINALKVMSVSPSNGNYSIELLGGNKFLLFADQFPWLMKICGFLLQLKSGVAINSFEIAGIDHRDGKPVLIGSNGSIFQLEDSEVDLLFGDVEKENGEVNNGFFASTTHLENRAQFLSSKNIGCEDYKKL